MRHLLLWCRRGAILVGALSLTVLAAPAFAQGAAPAGPASLPAPLGDPWAVVILAAAGAFIRPLTALLTERSRDGGPIGVALGILAAALTAGGAAISDLGGTGSSVSSIALAFGLAFVGSAAANAKVWGGRAVDWIHDRTDAWLTTLFGAAPDPAPAPKAGARKQPAAKASGARKR